MAAILGRAAPRLPGSLPPEAQQQRTRSYQREMFEESIRRNIIVAMDTGSGKTHIAILRIIWQLEKADGKLAWFLVPNVSLAQQQFDVLKQALPPVNTQFLTGHTAGIEKWSNQEIWDGVLGDKEGLIVSTHQVLLDALAHAFVRMERIGLLVFDEAHHAIGSHPANQIMQEFYHPRYQQGLPVPDILGLSASPIISAKMEHLRTVEWNLHAIARTPTVHRAELMAHVHPPKLQIVVYNPSGATVPASNPPSVIGKRGFFGDLDMGPKFELPFLKNDKEDRYLPGFMGSLPSNSNEQRLSGFLSTAQVPAAALIDNSDSIDPLTGELAAELLVDEEEDTEYETIDFSTGESVASGPKHVSSNTKHYEPQRSILPSPPSPEFEVIDPFAIAPVPEPEPTPKAHKATEAQWGKSAALRSVEEVYDSMDILEDPYVLSLQKEDTRGAARRLEIILKNENTRCQLQMKTLRNKAIHIFEEYGGWASDWFIREAVQKFQKVVAAAATDNDADHVQFFGEVGEDGNGKWQDAEKEYLRKLTQQIILPDDLGAVQDRCTAKVRRFIKLLVEEYHSEGEGFSGLTFVEQRVGVIALSQILQTHPQTRNPFKVGTMVGMGESGKRTRFLHDLVAKNEKDTLARFRKGEKNLIVSTSVLEEGLDLPDCHLVVCFVPPNNLKSFVQRRGRARRTISTYMIMVPADLDANKMREFESMEQDMIRIYSEAERELQEELGKQENSSGGDEGRVFKVASTGALLSLANAIPHLYHFCACIPSQEFVDCRPDFRVFDAPGFGKDKMAEVILPNSIHPDVRRTESKTAWKGEKWAKRDAAFQAFVNLYELGLVTNNLMPLVKAELKRNDEVEKRTPRVDVEETLDPWSLIEDKWVEGRDIYSSLVSVWLHDGEKVEVQMLLPAKIEVDDFVLYWVHNQEVKVTVGPSKHFGKVTPELIERGRSATYLLFEGIFSTRMERYRKDFPYLFIPAEGEAWDVTGNKKLNGLETVYSDMKDFGLVTCVTKYVFQGWRTDIDTLEDEILLERYGERLKTITPGQPVMECMQLPKRRDFVHIHPNKGPSKGPKTEFLLPEFAEVSALPWRYSKLAMLLPCIIDRVGKTLIAVDMQCSVLKPLPFLTTTLVRHATTASAAREPTDYERLEFLGDSVLKTLTSIALYDEHPLWHEGYLAGGKDRIVSNTTLCAASMEKRLSRWIITNQFTALKWHPAYINSMSSAQQKRMLSTKTLADVIESLIGASYITSGLEGSTQCCRLFKLHLNSWLPLSERVRNINTAASTAATKFPGKVPTHISPGLENLLGYKFKNKALLLEALTHLSFESDTVSMSYQRLEFLGDAILDMVVVDELYRFPGLELSHVALHNYRSAVVNAHFLAFLCMSFEADMVLPRAHQDSKTGVTTVRDEVVKAPLYRFIRQTHKELTAQQSKTYARYLSLKGDIQYALEWEDTYPWVELIALDAPKHISDVVESIIAAIWIDSNGDFGVVKEFLERLGLMKIVRRMVQETVEATHPTSRLGMKVAMGKVVTGTLRYEIVEEEEEKFGCVVRVSGEVLAEVTKCVSAIEAKARVAFAGLKVLEERERELWKNGKEMTGVGGEEAEIPMEMKIKLAEEELEHIDISMLEKQDNTAKTTRHASKRRMYETEGSDKSDGASGVEVFYDAEEA